MAIDKSPESILLIKMIKLNFGPSKYAKSNNAVDMIVEIPENGEIKTLPNNILMGFAALNGRKKKVEPKKEKIKKVEPKKEEEKKEEKPKTKEEKKAEKWLKSVR